jgi:hypothetical protein
VSAFERVERREVTTTTTLWRKGEPDKLDSGTTVTTRYTVTGVEAVPLYGDGSGRLYVPVAVVVERLGNMAGVTVTVIGALRRKGGSLSELRHVIHALSGWSRTPRPAWLVEITEDAAR